MSNPEEIERLRDCLADAFANYCRDNPDPDHLPEPWVDLAQELLGDERANEVYGRVAEQVEKGPRWRIDYDNESEYEGCSEARLRCAWCGSVQRMRTGAMCRGSDRTEPEHRDKVISSVLDLMAEACREIDRAGPRPACKSNRHVVAETTLREDASVDDWRQVIQAQLRLVRGRPEAHHYLRLSTITRPRVWAKLRDSPTPSDASSNGTAAP